MMRAKSFMSIGIALCVVEAIYAFDVPPGGRVTNERPFVKLRDPEQGPRATESS